MNECTCPAPVNSQYSDWRKNSAQTGKSLPDIAYLEGLLGSLGITNQTHIVLTPIGVNASEIAIATRIYWTLKVLGHEKISILDGGLIAYSMLPNPEFSNQRPNIERKIYKASPDLSLAPSAADVLDAWKKGTAFVDYRSEMEYLGKTPGPRPGTIPGAKNLPFDLMTEKTKGARFLSKDQIEALYKDHDIETGNPEIAFCNSGHRASLAWFVAHEILGNKAVKLFDGSMAVWSRNKDYPVSIPKR